MEGDGRAPVEEGVTGAVDGPGGEATTEEWHNQRRMAASICQSWFARLMAAAATMRGSRSARGRVAGRTGGGRSAATTQRAAAAFLARVQTSQGT